MSDTEAAYTETEYQESVYQYSDDELEQVTDEEQEPHGEPQAGPSVGNPSSMPCQSGTISNIVLEQLQERWSAWKVEKGNKRKTVWRTLVKELRGLPEHKALTREQWDVRIKVRLRISLLLMGFCYKRPTDVFKMDA